MNNVAKKNLIKHLFKRHNGLCYYCKCKTVLQEKTITPLPDNYATIEHLFPKNDIRRFLLTDSEQTVLACNRCNNDKANEWNRYFDMFYNGSDLKVDLVKRLKRWWYLKQELGELF